MIKSILILATLQIFLFCSEQIVLVVAEDFNTSKAFLECYEDGKKVCGTFEVNIGTNGLGWGLGEVELSQKKSEPLKKEGDKKAPAGVFKLSKIFGYEKEKKFHMPYIYTAQELICVDDVNSSFYNQIILMRGDEGGSTLGVPQNEPKSFEFMQRNDNQYELGIVVEHNKNAVQEKGSCIFMHVSKKKDASTAGCTSMSLDEIKNITSWLNSSKNPILIQIPKSSAKEILQLYPELRSSELLH
ncbi:MAG: L,D-transpeptidase family protein [Campylobacterales bacterium]|nr:L,D-transpeptidase family protein [Campylobacterales bacterium]